MMHDAEAVTGVPVAEMKDDYTKATYALTISLEKYITLDPYDKERFEVIKVHAPCQVLMSGVKFWYGILWNSRVLKNDGYSPEYRRAVCRQVRGPNADGRGESYHKLVTGSPCQSPLCHVDHCEHITLFMRVADT